MVEALRAASVAGDAARVETLEKAFGLIYTPGTLLFNESLSGMVRCPSKLYIDWQHAVVASGEVSQYEVNQRVRHIIYNSEFTLGHLDEFARAVSLPKAEGKLGKILFSERFFHSCV